MVDNGMGSILWVHDDFAVIVTISARPVAFLVGHPQTHKAKDLFYIRGAEAGGMLAAFYMLDDLPAFRALSTHRSHYCHFASIRSIEIELFRHGTFGQGPPFMQAQIIGAAGVVDWLPRLQAIVTKLLFLRAEATDNSLC